MEQTRQAIAPNLAERLRWHAARRDDSRVVRRLYQKPGIDGVYQLGEGALLDEFFSFLHELGVGDWLSHVQGTAVQREMVPFVQSLLSRACYAFYLNLDRRIGRRSHGQRRCHRSGNHGPV
jgi:hypothetical protein